MKNILDQLEKDNNGAITTILILTVIFHKKRTWGYEIKKNLKKIMNSKEIIKDSTLYTKLKELENEELIFSERELNTPRKYYEITPKGEKLVNLAIKRWFRIVKNNIEAFDKLGFVQFRIKEKR
ncbi:MAG: PadR family transcriptional regulator [Candidatus Hodarchaeales archaeon]